MTTKEDIINTLFDYYDNLDNLTMRLQENYNDGKPFKQFEEDRLSLCFILDTIDQYESQPIKDIMINNIIEIRLNMHFYLFVENLEDNEKLLIELFSYENDEFFFNTIDILNHNLTSNNTIKEIKEYGKKILESGKDEINKIVNEILWGE